MTSEERRQPPSGAAPAADANTREAYSHPYSAQFTAALAQRTAAREAAFFLPYLRAGMAVLDCGCGPGSITLGLAEAVVPGDAVGIDVAASQIEQARAEATARGVTNVRFEVASVYDVPLPAGSVDAVFFHNVLQHLGQPAAALTEAYRVLRPGGVVGIRDSDFGSTIRAPDAPLVHEAAALYLRWWQHNGGNPFLSRNLRRLLREAGFTRIVSSASTWCHAAPETARQWGEGFAHVLGRANFVEQVLERGWTDRRTLEAMIAAWQTWGADPDALRSPDRLRGRGLARLAGREREEPPPHPPDQP